MPTSSRSLPFAMRTGQRSGRSRSRCARVNEAVDIGHAPSLTLRFGLRGESSRQAVTQMYTC
jgi:hypothetical protein